MQTTLHHKNDQSSEEDRSQTQWPIKQTNHKNNNFQTRAVDTHMVSALVKHRPWRGRTHANELQVNTK